MGNRPWGCKKSDTTERLTHTETQNLNTRINIKCVKIDLKY